jgi:transglutaminase-like putative cysteine protease
MELKNLLSVVIATLTALGAMLYAMGSQTAWLAMALWMAAVVSLVVTDFLGAVHLPRNLASLLMWGVMAIFLPHFIAQSNWDNRLHSVASILLCLQMALLFQQKDSRVYGWLAVMSLLQAVVAARYNEGVAFGGLLIGYTLVGMLALTLLVMHSQWERQQGELDGRKKQTTRAFTFSFTRAAPRVSGRLATAESGSGRWPLAAMPSSFAGAPAGTTRSGVVSELFARLAILCVGALLLAGVIFSTVPRPHLSAWHGEGTKSITTVGFDDKITLGTLGEAIENPQEVMQLKLVDPATNSDYSMRDDVYLRGSVVNWYSQNHWRFVLSSSDSQGITQLPSDRSTPVWVDDEQDSSDSDFQLGPPLVQQITLEPYLDRKDVFYIWPLMGPLDEGLRYHPLSSRLEHLPRWPHGGNFKWEVTTTGLVDGHQPALVPASQKVYLSDYLQMPNDRSPLPRVKALASRWLKESGLRLHQQYEIAHHFEQQLANSGQFHYTLKGQERDTSIDAIEDFVSNNPRGHCEYFATTLAMMLRSLRIPSRVVLGYRCDEWHEEQQCYQVRQLHAHAWVEAFLAHEQIPEALRRNGRINWTYGGWLRLDPTPADDVGTQAARRTMWGTWQARWHGLQRTWDKYIVDMDFNKQRDSVYEPISRAIRSLISKLFDVRWWKELVSVFWASLAATQRSGIIGWLCGVAVLIVLLTVPVTVGWWLARFFGRIWRRFSKASDERRARVHSSIEFYQGFEQIVARIGLQRAVGQTPCEFAHKAGVRLAAISGRRELYTRAMQVVDAFYRVRFGRQALSPAAIKAIEQALQELTAASNTLPP